MHKKKVLFMINSMYGGGAEKIFQTLLNNLEPSKYDITVLDTPTNPNCRNSLNVCLVLSVKSFLIILKSNSTKNMYIFSINPYIIFPISIYTLTSL